MRLFPVLLIAALATSGCARLAESRINPLNWFGGSRVAEPSTGPLEPLVPANRDGLFDGRSLVAEIVSVSLDRTPDGGILRASGRATSQGWFNAELVLTGVEGGVATFAFRAEAPSGFSGTGSASSRLITAATTLSLSELSGVRSLRVQGAGNSRTVRR